MNQNQLPVWRSLMYVPVSIDKYVDKAHPRGADVVQLNIEDAVPFPDNDRARTLVEAAAHKVRRGGAIVVVRKNAPVSLAVHDVEPAVNPDLDG